MPDRTHQRPNKANAEANALASWDNEGGAVGGQNERAPRQSPRAFLIWEIWAKADICGQSDG
jgi:hypothetical protein